MGLGWAPATFESSLAARRLIAGACLEEVLRNVSTILVAVAAIFQRGRVVGREGKRCGGDFESRWRGCLRSLPRAIACPKSCETRGKKRMNRQPSLLEEREAEIHDTGCGDTLGGKHPQKGEWGVLIVDTKSDRFCSNRTRIVIFVPASNMKLLTTALALATRGPTIGFATTLEAQTACFSGRQKSTALYILLDAAIRTFPTEKFPF